MIIFNAQKVKAKDLKQGDRFCYSGREFVALGWEQNGVLAVAKELIKGMPFDEGGSNDWGDSSLRKYLNGDFSKKEFDLSGLLPFTSDLTADDGLKDYVQSVDFVFLLSADLYRKYKYFMPKWDTWVWLITPRSGPSHCGPSHYARNVRFVHADGTLGNYYADIGIGVAIACLINPETSVSCAEEYKEESNESVRLQKM